MSQETHELNKKYNKAKSNALKYGTKSYIKEFDRISTELNDSKIQDIREKEVTYKLFNYSGGY
jgi:hypothetical protein